MLLKLTTLPAAQQLKRYCFVRERVESNQGETPAHFDSCCCCPGAFSRVPSSGDESVEPQATAGRFHAGLAGGVDRRAWVLGLETGRCLAVASHRNITTQHNNTTLGLYPVVPPRPAGLQATRRAGHGVGPLLNVVGSRYSTYRCARASRLQPAEVLFECDEKPR